MNSTGANIDIVRGGGKLNSVSVALPVWSKNQIDGTLSVSIPMLNINTVAWNDADVQVALTEALTLFVLNCEKFGEGLENELKLAGWNFTNKSSNKTSMCWGTDDEVIERIMATGNDFAQTLEMSF